jgi:hypothetical protein
MPFDLAGQTQTLTLKARIHTQKSDCETFVMLVALVVD